jgi:hypothetical protein
MSKLTVAQLIGETPEMMRACGEVIKWEYHTRDAVNRAVQSIPLDNEVTRAAWGVADIARGILESARENVASLKLSEKLTTPPAMDNWSDQEIDVYVAVYGKGACDK